MHNFSYHRLNPYSPRLAGPSPLPGSDVGPNGSEAEDDGNDISAAQAFHDAIKEKAELGHVSGDTISSFEEILVLMPRGRYDVDMFPDFLHLQGKMYGPQSKREIRTRRSLYA